MDEKSGGRPSVVVVGGGFAGLETVLYIRRLIGDRARLTLVSSADRFLFRPYLTYLPFGVLSERLEIPLPDFCRAHGASFIRGRVKSDGPNGSSIVVGERPIPYDYLVIATGACYRRPIVPGLSERALLIGDEGDLHALRESLQGMLERPEDCSVNDIAFIVPAECHWPGPLYEMAFMIETWLRWKSRRDGVRFTFVTSEQEFMEDLGPTADQVIKREFASRGIVGFSGQTISRVEDRQVVCEDGLRIPYDLLLSTASCEGSPVWKGWPVDEVGFLKVEPDSRRVQGSPSAFAAGDASNHRVKQAFQALLQADTVGEHIVSRLEGRAPRFTFRPAGFWILEQLDQALLFQPKIADSSDSGAAVQVLSVGDRRRIDLSHILSRQIDTSNPLYAGLLWKGAKAGLRVLPFLLRSEEVIRRHTPNDSVRG